MLNGSKAHIHLDASPVIPEKCQMHLTYQKINCVLIYHNHEN